jgi:DeoR family fructose operon transcriptional repressor
MIRLLRESGTLRIGELTERFEVSDETVRRDLSALEQQGLLTRTRGGAIAEGVHVETSFQRRLREGQADKVAIAAVAAELVDDGSTIIMDSGSTMAHLVPFLLHKRDLVVITNGVHHVEPLLENPSVTVVLTGGLIRRVTRGASGQLAVEALENLRADHTFIATDGFSADTGMTYPSFEEVAVKRAMIQAGVEVTLLADGSKSGRASMVKVAPLSVLNRIITSPPIPATEEQRIRELGVELVMVDVPTASGLQLIEGANGDPA